MSFNEFEPLHLPPLNGYDLIELALMHKSYINERLMCFPARRKQQIIEHKRLAHLGDSIMNAAVTDYLFEEFPNADQGFLSKLSQPLKAREGARLYAKAVGLDSLSKCGRGIGNRDKQGDMFGEMFEALVGAIYWSSDRDFALTRDWFQTQCAGVIKRQLSQAS